MYLTNEFETKDIALIRFPCSAVSQNGPHTQFGIHGRGLQAAPTPKRPLVGAIPTQMTVRLLHSSTKPLCGQTR